LAGKIETELLPGWTDTVESRTIHGVPVFVFERHNWALLPWSLLSRNNPSLSLISIDHHTDCHPPFTHYCYGHLPNGHTVAQLKAAIDRELAKVDVANDESVVNAVSKLRHDEQIQAALRLNVFNTAYVISFQAPHDEPRSAELEDLVKQLELGESLKRLESGLPDPELPPRPFNYPASPVGLYLVGHACVPGCQKSPHDDDCLRRLYDAAIETPYLRQQLDVANEMAVTGARRRSCVDQPYVLDIDLDVFHTRRSVAPADSSLFHELIRGATAITIAKEPGCVVSLQLEGEGLSANWLLDRVLDHIRQALGAESGTQQLCGPL
jgi:hypothetical protein